MLSAAKHPGCQVGTLHSIQGDNAIVVPSPLYTPLSF